MEVKIVKNYLKSDQTCVYKKNYNRGRQLRDVEAGGIL